MIDVMEEIMTNQATDAQKAAFLTALAIKGETIEEITSAAKVMRLHCERFLNDMDVFRNCLVLVEMALIRLIYQLYLHWLYLQRGYPSR